MPNSRDDCHLCHIHDHNHPSSLLRTSTLRDSSPPPRPRRHSRSGSIDKEYRSHHEHSRGHHHHHHHHHDRERHHSRAGRVPSALARLSEHHSSHSLPASRSNTLNLYPEQVSVLPDGGHRYIGGDRASVRSLELTSPRHAPDNRSHHSLHQTTSLQKPPPLIHTSPDILTTSLPPLRSHGSHLSLNGTPALPSPQDRTQDYFMQVNRLPFKDDSRKHRFNLQTVMLIGCYTLLFVMAIIIGVVLCHQNGWLGFGSPDTLSANDDTSSDPNTALGSVRGDFGDNNRLQNLDSVADPGGGRLNRLRDGTNSNTGPPIPVHNVVQVRNSDPAAVNVAGVFTSPGGGQGGRPRSITGSGGRVNNIPGNRPIQSLQDTSLSSSSSDGDQIASISQNRNNNRNRNNKRNNNLNNNQQNVNQNNMNNNHDNVNNNNNPSNMNSNDETQINLNNNNNVRKRNNNNNLNDMNSNAPNQNNINNNNNVNIGNNNNHPNNMNTNDPNQNNFNSNINGNNGNNNNNPNNMNTNDPNQNNHNNNNNNVANTNNNNNNNINHHNNLNGNQGRNINGHTNTNPHSSNNHNNQLPNSNQGSNFHGPTNIHSGQQNQQSNVQSNAAVPLPQLINTSPGVPVPSLVSSSVPTLTLRASQAGGNTITVHDMRLLPNPPPIPPPKNPFNTFVSSLHPTVQSNEQVGVHGLSTTSHQSSNLVHSIPNVNVQSHSGNPGFTNGGPGLPQLVSQNIQPLNHSIHNGGLFSASSLSPNAHIIGQDTKHNPSSFSGFPNVPLETKPTPPPFTPQFPPPLPTRQTSPSAGRTQVFVSNNVRPPVAPPVQTIPQGVVGPVVHEQSLKQQFNLDNNPNTPGLPNIQGQSGLNSQFNTAKVPSKDQAKNDNTQVNQIHMEKMKMLKEILDAEGSAKLLQDLITLKNNRNALSDISENLSEITVHGPSPSINSPAPQRNVASITSQAILRHRDTLNGSAALFVNTGGNQAQTSHQPSPSIKGSLKTPNAGLNSGDTANKRPASQQNGSGATKSKSNIQVVRELLASLISSPEVQEILSSRNRQKSRQAQPTGRANSGSSISSAFQGDEMRALLLKALAKEIPSGQSLQTLRVHGPQPSVTRKSVPETQSTRRRGDKAIQPRGKITRAQQLLHFNATTPSRPGSKTRGSLPTRSFSSRMGVAETKSKTTSTEHQSVRPPTLRTSSRGRIKPTPDFRLRVKSDGKSGSPATGTADSTKKKMVTESVDMRAGKDDIEGEVVRHWRHMDNDGTVSQGTVRRDGSFAFTNCRPVEMCQNGAPGQ